MPNKRSKAAKVVAVGALAYTLLRVTSLSFLEILCNILIF